MNSYDKYLVHAYMNINLWFIYVLVDDVCEYVSVCSFVFILMFYTL